ncbi:fatty acid elongase [Strigomonas culicis]|uniref:Elongation of fatty acids protein n=1 Tax=Strigomonas culicis TaxID=28005 RepID=S9V9C1_9TRYP|nr:fatty acid elongase [Strigomonas culicis]|eukprot:EPY23571.1 fatty acid elongase [Strigomonas culicis]
MQFVDQWGETSYSGYGFKTWLSNNKDVALSISFLYLMFVFYAPRYIPRFMGEAGTEKNKIMQEKVKKVWVVWNLFLSAFAFYGTTRVFPPLIKNFMKYGIHDTFCTFRPEEFYTTEIGTALGLFTMSKLPEFGDTVFLLLLGKKLPFLQFFHHTSMFLFVWFAYEQGSSIFITAAAYNYFVHTIMYFYFALAEAGLKNVVKPFGIYITALQITQMVGGLFFTGYSVYHNYRKVFDPSAPGCPGTDITVSRTQLLVYIFNFYLFSEMFVKSYILPPPKRAEKPAAGAEKKKSA